MKILPLNKVLNFEWFIGKFGKIIPIDELVIDGIYKVDARNYTFALWNGGRFEAVTYEWGQFNWDTYGFHCQQDWLNRGVGGDVYPLERLY